MATYDLAKGGTAQLPWNESGEIYRLFMEIDFSLTPYSAADVLQLFNIPAGSLVDRVGYEVVTAEGAVMTFDLGDGANAAGYISNANGNSAGARGVNTLALTEGAPNTVTGYSHGKLYTADDTLDLVLDNNASAAKVRVWAVVMPFFVS